MVKLSIEERIGSLERDMNWAKPIVSQLSKELDLRRPRINILKYCRDEFDRKIIDYLIDHIGAGATEIAKGVGHSDPEKLGRHLVGKRLKRMSVMASTVGDFILTFDAAVRENPISKEKKYRAWWLNIDEVDIELFKKSMEE